MALTKVTGDFIKDGVLTQAHLHTSHGITTAHIGEGSNLYFTTARANTAIGDYLTTNSYATQSYVNTQVSNLVDSAPSTLDTLNELAAALGDDANFSTTVTNSIATKLPLAGGTLTGNLQLNDNIHLNIGSSADFKLYHNSSSGNSNIENHTGHLYITNYADDKDIKFLSDNGSGGTEIYFELQGVSGGANPFTVFPDMSHLVFGNGHDFRVYHNGTTSNSNIENWTGSLYVTNYADDQDIVFRSDDGSGGVNTYMTIDGSADRTVFSRSTRHNDGVIAAFGTSEDLQIYHDGSHSYINEVGTGVLAIQTNGSEIQLNSTGGEYLARFIPDSSVKLYHNNSLKFQTETTGVGIVGDADVSGNVFVGGANSNFSENNLRFKSSGAAYIDHNTAGQSFIFRVSNSSSLDTTALTISSNGNSTFSGNIVINGSGSSGNAFNVTRGSDSTTALRVQNTGEVVTQANYFYANGPGVSMYVQNTAVFRGGIMNDGSNADVRIADNLTVEGTVKGDIYYDRNNTGYYLNPESWSYIYGFTNEVRYGGGSYSDPDPGVTRDAKFGNNGIAAASSKFTGNVTAPSFIGKLMGGANGAPDATIWCVSGSYTDWGIFYDENSPDVIQFKSSGNVKATISLDNGDYTGRNATLTGDLTADQVITTNNGSGQNYRIGDDAWIGDINVANTFRISGNQNGANGYITFGNSSNDALGRAGTGALTWAGNTIWHAGNDGSGSGLDADTLDGSHASSFWTKSGSWYGDLGSHSYTREIGLAMTGGSEFVILSKSGQGSVLIDGHYMSYEAANGFFGSYNSAYGNLTGIRASAANTLKVMQLDGGNAILEVTQDVRAPLYYDSNNTTYYVNPATSSLLKAVQIDTTDNAAGSAFKVYSTTNHQYPQIYSNGNLEAMVNYRNNNAQWYVGLRTTSQLVGTSGFHFYNTTLSQTVGGWDINGHSYSIASSRAPIFYDSNDTSYYTNPNGDSVMNQIHINDYIRHNGDLDTYMGFNGANSWKLHVGGGDRLIATTSQFTSNLNVAAPLYYDKDSTAHYVHPGNLSNLSGLNVQYGNMDLRYSNTVDMTGSSYNQSTYYPVRIYVSDITRIRIENRLNAGGTHPSWATHGSGFSLVMDWYTNGSGWGTVGVARTLRQWNEAWTNVTICGGITQMTNSSAEVVWLRGGGKYLIKTSFNNTVQVSSSSHTANSQTVTPTTSIVNDVYSSSSGSISAGNIYGHKFWDAGDANYFLNPADTGVSLKVKGTAEFVTAAGNLRGYIRATDTNDSHFIIATSGGEDIAFKDGGTSGNVNMIIRGDGDVLTFGNNYGRIWYDYDNSAYYINPASTSNLNAATFAGNVIGQNAYFGQDVGIGFTSGSIGGNLNIRNSAAGQTAAKIELGSSSNGSTIGAFIHTGASYASSGMFLNFQSNHISGDDNVLICYLDGDLVNKNNSYTQYSDERLKENIVDATPKLNEIKQIKVRNFNFKGEDLKQIGIVAQELEPIFPALVKEREVPGHEDLVKTVKYSVLVPILVKAMQEQQTIIDDLKSRLETLENQ